MTTTPFRFLVNNSIQPIFCFSALIKTEQKNKSNPNQIQIKSGMRDGGGAAAFRTDRHPTADGGSRGNKSSLYPPSAF